MTADPRITVHLNATLDAVEGFVGNFRSTIRVNAQRRVIEHGVTVMASGARELQPEEYLFGTDPRVITGLELDRRLKADDPGLSRMQTAVFIQCVDFEAHGFKVSTALDLHAGCGSCGSSSGCCS